MRSKIVVGLIVVSFSISCQKQINSVPGTFKNPILRGFYPDPSICRVGDDYYLVNSSFVWYPGVPVFHSKDLVNWQQIGFALNRPEQLNIKEGLRASRGIFAPTIRYNKGIFYIITTCVGCGGNFYVTAQNPAGPWSDPVWLDAPGIDPTLFWDDDGTCWYIGAHNISGNSEWEGQNGIFIQRIDLEKGKLTGEPTQLTYGHATNAVWGEGPHIYKIGERYMLMIAEGGTSYHHAITVFESDSINGIYKPSQINPVLTHRHLGHNYPIFAVGHCDIIETQNGEWWGVLLAVRSCEGMNLLGRETYLVPLEFENNWPVFNKGIGRVQFREKLPNLPPAPTEQYPVRDNFESEKLALKYSFLRTPEEVWHQIKDGQIYLKLRPQVITKQEQPSLITQRITEFSFESFIQMNFTPEHEYEEAGFVAIYNNKRNYRLVKTLEEGQLVLKLFKTKLGEETLVNSINIEDGPIVLGLVANRLKYQFYYGKNKNSMKLMADIQDATVNASQSGIDFTGPMIGIYASSNGVNSTNKAAFDWFEYKGLPDNSFYE